MRRSTQSRTSSTSVLRRTKTALARPLIKRRLETQHLVGRLAARLQANTQARVEETANVENNRRDLDAMRQKAEVLLDESVSAGGVSVTRLDTTVTDADVEVELLREKHDASGEPVMTPSNRPGLRF